MGRSITSRPRPMKSSSGRARGASHLAASFAHAGLRTTAHARVAATLGASLCGLALLFAPAAPAFAQKSDVVSRGPAVRDATPEADASIAQKNWSAALVQLDARIAQNP